MRKDKWIDKWVMRPPPWWLRLAVALALVSFMPSDRVAHLRELLATLFLA